MEATSLLGKNKNHDYILKVSCKDSSESSFYQSAMLEIAHNMQLV